MGRAMRARQAARARTKRIRTAAFVTVAVVAVVAAVVIIVAVSGNSGGTAAGSGSGAVDTTNASVGKAFPDFTLTAIDGSQVSKSSLAGKPSLVWFTTVNCLPAQVGAGRVSDLNEQLGNRYRV